MCCPSFSLCGVRGGFSLSFSRLARGVPSRLPLGDGRAGLQASAGGRERRLSAALPASNQGGRAAGEKGGPAGKSGLGGGVRSRIALQYALNKGGHLDLIGSNALFSDPICLSPAEVWGTAPSYCGPIILQIYSRQGSHYRRCQRRNPSCRGTADHEKEGPSGRQGKQNSRPTPHTPHSPNKQA